MSSWSTWTALRAAVLVIVSVAALVSPAAALGEDTPLVAGDRVTGVLVGAGDIAGPWLGDDETAKLLDRIPGQVFTTGDNAYLMGSTPEYLAWYELTWGRHKARTRPAPGNHDYEAGGGGNGSAYFDYFGAAAGPRDKGYYSYDVGDWHVVVLNQECTKVQGGCGPDSVQAQWLRDDLAANPARCTAAVLHYPRFNSGGKGETAGTQRGQAFWDILYANHVDIVLSGDEHVYERFAPQTPAGVRDEAHGIRQFTVGTGGGLSGSFSTPKPNSEARIAGVFGVLKLTLGTRSYAWEFVPVEGRTETDSGTALCHAPEE